MPTCLFNITMMMMEDKRILSNSTTMPIPIPNEVVQQQQQQEEEEKEDAKGGGHAEKCPRCNSSNTKFCYYNNYSLTQPRHFCKSCKRYWTLGGSLRNVPVGGSSRKNKRLKHRRHLSSPPPPLPINPLLSSDNLPSFPSSSSIDDQLSIDHLNYYYSSFNHDNNYQLPLLPLDYLLLPCDNIVNNINLSSSDHDLYWNSGSDVFI